MNVPSVACSSGVSSDDVWSTAFVGIGGNGPGDWAVIMGPISEATDGARPILVRKATNDETTAS